MNLHTIVDDFIADKQLDVVVLGCTELPLIFDEGDNETVIDTLQVLAQGLLATFVGDGPM